MPPGPDPQTPSPPSAERGPSPTEIPPAPATPERRPAQRPPQQQRPPTPGQRRQPPPRMPKPRRHRNGNATRARIGLVVVFVLLRLVDAFFVIALPGGPSGLPFAAVLLTAMWTTAVLIAIWRRQQWARIILIGLFALAAVGALVMIPNTSNNTPFITAYVALAAVAVGCGGWLLYSRDVRRLTSRDRE